LAAGLHAIVRLGFEFDSAQLALSALRRSVVVYPLSYAFLQPQASGDSLVLGYANLSEPAIEEGIARLAEAIGEL
ncbi:MAG TPA: hypothetical protein VH115_09580, partial [Solirubrobacteraceae bacterium]|nr:hypothetical protein [Solirubrobacteraceae bacterium]